MAEKKSINHDENESYGFEVRRSPRRVYKHPIGILHGGRYQILPAEELGESGLVFAAQSSFGIGDLVLATLVMPDGGHVIVRGHIAEETRLQAGLRYTVNFKELDLHQRRTIRSYVSGKTKQEAADEASVRTIADSGQAPGPFQSSKAHKKTAA